MLTLADCESILDCALFYRRLGFSVIPLAARQKCPIRGFTWRRYSDTPASDAELYEWFHGRNLNLAICLGPASNNLVFRDFDDPESYRNWRENFPSWADRLPTVISGRKNGGYHVYVRTDPRVFKHRFGK